MTVHRFFVPPEQVAGDRFEMPQAIERQVRSVLRLRDGDRIVLLTGDGSEAICRLEAGGCVVEERRPSAGEPAHRLTLVQALLKGDGLETVIQQGTELGVAAFRLVVTERCVLRELSPRKLERLRTIAREAAEQSERGHVPPIATPTSLDAALRPGMALLYERHADQRLGDLAPPSAVVVGPEGGFTAAEVTMAIRTGLEIAGLGPRILRSTTVAAAAAAAILARTGDFA